MPSATVSPVIVGPSVLRITIDIDSMGNRKINCSKPVSPLQIISICNTIAANTADMMLSQVYGDCEPNGKEPESGDSAKNDNPTGTETTDDSGGNPSRVQ